MSVRKDRSLSHTNSVCGTPAKKKVFKLLKIYLLFLGMIEIKN